MTDRFTIGFPVAVQRNKSERLGSLWTDKMSEGEGEVTFSPLFDAATIEQKFAWIRDFIFLLELERDAIIKKMMEEE